MENSKFKSLVEIDDFRNKIICYVYIPYNPVKSLYWRSLNNSPRVILRRSWGIKTFLLNPGVTKMNKKFESLLKTFQEISEEIYV